MPSPHLSIGAIAADLYGPHAADPDSAEFALTASLLDARREPETDSERAWLRRWSLYLDGAEWVAGVLAA